MYTQRQKNRTWSNIDTKQFQAGHVYELSIKPFEYIINNTILFPLGNLAGKPISIVAFLTIWPIPIHRQHFSKNSLKMLNQNDDRELTVKPPKINNIQLIK